MGNYNYLTKNSSLTCDVKIIEKYQDVRSISQNCIKVRKHNLTNEDEQ